MKVFLSWSGDTSHKVACELRSWLPSVIQSIKPYVSSEDIYKGTRWSTDIANELFESGFGVIVVTKSNIDAPWINFEAGALSKTIDRSNVCPLLFRLKPSELSGPLLQFQSTTYEREDVFKLVSSMNSRLAESERIDDFRLTQTFNVWWPQLEAKLDLIGEEETENQPTEIPYETVVLEEILNLVRGQQRLLSNPEELLPSAYVRHVLHRDEFSSKRQMEFEMELDAMHSAVLELDRHIQFCSAQSGDGNFFNDDLMRLMNRLHESLHRIQRRGSSKRPYFLSK